MSHTRDRVAQLKCAVTGHVRSLCAYDYPVNIRDDTREHDSGPYGVTKPPNGVQINRKRRYHPWQQVWRDVIAVSSPNEWEEMVAHIRTRYYDQVRPYVYRGTLLSAIALGVVVQSPPGTRRRALSPLLPAALQVGLEIYLNRFVRPGVTVEHGHLARPAIEIMDDSYGRRILNVTGILGAIACPLNILAITHGTPAGKTATVKLGSLSASLLYLNSGLAGVFLDTPHWSHQQQMPGPLPKLRPASSFLSVAIVEMIIADSIRRQRWTPGSGGAAVLCGLASLALGANLREYDRTVAAAGEVAESMVRFGRERLALMTHNDLQPAKEIYAAIQGVPSVPSDAIVAARNLSGTIARIQAVAGQPSDTSRNLNDDLKAYFEDAVTRYELKLKSVIPGDAPDVENAIWIDDVSRVLLDNVGQERQRRIQQTGDRTGRRARIEVSLNKDYCTVRVHDQFALIPEEKWCPRGSTTSRLQRDLADKIGGTLKQSSSPQPDFIKFIEARWELHRPKLHIASIREAR